MSYIIRDVDIDGMAYIISPSLRLSVNDFRYLNNSLTSISSGS